MEVKIYDTAFAHTDYSTLQTSKFFKWVRTNDVRKISFFTDSSLWLVNQSQDEIKIGWLIEPRAINSSTYEFVKFNHQYFDYILTYDSELLSISDKFIFYPHGGCWINDEDKKIHEKNKLVSIILSSKRMTIGHNFRHEIINKIHNLDIFGHTNPVDNKITALKDYAFSIIIENSKSDYYFTEKLIDSFITGTVPIYWGCPSIGDFFNSDGMIIIDNIESLQNELNTISLERYNLMISAIKENFEIAKKYIISEDWIYNNTKLLK